MNIKTGSSSGNKKKDPGLPDSQGIETLVRIRDHSPDIPVIVLTGLDDEKMAIKSVQSGSQDYLIKGRIESNLLTRSICYAIERNHLQLQLEQMRSRQCGEMEKQVLDQLMRPAATSITAQFQSVVTLKEAQDDVFKNRVLQYGVLIDQVLDQLRMMILELMGNLVSYYRNYAVTARPSTSGLLAHQ